MAGGAMVLSAQYRLIVANYRWHRFNIPLLVPHLVNKRLIISISPLLSENVLRPKELSPVKSRKNTGNQIHSRVQSPTCIPGFNYQFHSALLLRVNSLTFFSSIELL